MMFKQLQDMALFALVTEMGSFTAAAHRAGLPKSSVSQRISQLEQQVGIRLLNRTTRKLNLTFAGEHYLVHCREMLAASERAEYAIQRLRDNPSGRLRITSPAGITLLPAFLLEDKIESGALVQVLPEWSVTGNELWLAYPSRKLNSPALMSYIDFAMGFDEVKRFYVGAS